MLCLNVEWQYIILIYPTLVGGILSFTPTQFIKTNGFSNLYTRWGAEDDDMSKRILDTGMNITHLPLNYGKFHMIRHAKHEKSKNRNELLKYWTRWRYDGLNSLNNSLSLIKKKFGQSLELMKLLSTDSSYQDLLKEENLFKNNEMEKIGYSIRLDLTNVLSYINISIRLY
ncbi:unnamed protein product [Gordionus sp. m RMFG-2023]